MIPGVVPRLSVVVDPNARPGDPERTRRDAGGKVVEGHRLFDQALRDYEIETAHSNIVDALTRNHRASPRR